MKPVDRIDKPIDRPEVIEKRTMSSKTYDMGNGQFVVYQGAGAYHYKEDPLDDMEQWKEVDLSWRQVGDRYIMDTAPYIVELLTDGVGYTYTSRMGGSVEVRLTKVGGKNVDSLSLSKVPRINLDNTAQLGYFNILPRLGFRFDLKSLGIEIYKLIGSAQGPKGFEWRITRDISGKFSVKKTIVGLDNQQRWLDVSTIIGPEDRTQPEKIRYTIAETFNDRTVIIDPVTRIRSYSDDVKYPIEIDQDISEDISVTQDDGSERFYNGSHAQWRYMTNASQDNLTAGSFWDSDLYPGFRFQTVAIPEDATITQAYLKPKIKTFHGSSTVIELNFYADDIGDAPAWGVGEYPADMTNTTAVANFEINTSIHSVGDVLSIPITSILQEIVDGPAAGTWASGNDIRFGGFPAGLAGNSHACKFYDYVHGAANACDLEIWYTVGGGLSIPIPMYHYKNQ